MNEGELYYDESRDRLYAKDDGTAEHYFHCGDALQIWINHAWLETRAEYNENIGWYCYGVSDLYSGMEVRYYE